ncbi:MAG: MDR family MFS transporter [Acidobacteriota bacterium]
MLMPPGRDRRLVTTAILSGMVLAAIEATAVVAAMPSAVSELGGVEHYSWVFSIYLLTSTTTVPLYGKLADLYGRRRIFKISVYLFLLGSVLSGFAQSIEQLVVFRAIQGLGAGGVTPIGVTVAGDIYTIEERGRIQGVFSAVWAVASIIGPPLGGLVTDLLTWRWIFFLCVPFGLMAVYLLDQFLGESKPRGDAKLDIAGTVYLTVAVTALLLCLTWSDRWGWVDPRTVGLAGFSVLALGAFLWQENRAPEPMLPLDLFRNRIIAVSSVGNVLMGALMFGLISFIPIFGQGLRGGSALDAGRMLIPMLIAWPIAAVISGWLPLKIGYRPVLVIGGVCIATGTFLLTSIDGTTAAWLLLFALVISGTGLGFTSIPYVLAVQNAVPHERRGVATGTTIFFRQIGGAVAVAALGVVFNTHFLTAGPPGVAPDSVLDSELRLRLPVEQLGQLETALVGGLHQVFAALAFVAAGTLLVAFVFPGGLATEHAWTDDESTSAL